MPSSALSRYDRLYGKTILELPISINVPPPEIQELDAANSSRSSVRSGDLRRAEIPNAHEITEDVARAALLSHVQKKCCYGASAAKRMNIVKISPSSAFHYELQTFTEKRETSWAFTPYGGGNIDSSEFGDPPTPWDITVEPELLFHNEVKVMEVPHTATVKHCHRCHGAGSLLCHQCHGKGWTPCLTCHGDGWRTDSHGRRDLCFYCHSSTHGHGKQDCLKCNARGCVACPTCDGYGQIRCFIRLTITWSTVTAEHIVERCSLPTDLIKQVSGQVAFEEEGPRVLPIVTFPDATINLASIQLTKEHLAAFTDQRIVAQRQQIRIIPVTQVSYEWKSYSGIFVMLGFENRVHCPDYPQSCCCGCSIL
ncbi:unnamed protein product [Notodromas monacha]|uniref:Protein SSUH2 homolog n=1 Tax=Notodromas monacha TaxID=399045 RepID=A0A7R9BRL2_9CRUS|nr:unnamed protein product [Notodromas monacha]CAG0919517.1 unnamed protein product [Notodromas monacha]